MKEKIFTASTEIDASIIKGLLESNGIESLIDTGKGRLTPRGYLCGPSGLHGIFVEDYEVDKAVKILEEGGWIKIENNRQR